MEPKAGNSYKTSKKVLVFSPEKTLVLIGRSARSVARLLNLKTQSISYAANGKLVSTGGNYFRYIPSDIEVEINDIGTLTLPEWDKLCGIERKTYRVRGMYGTMTKNRQKRKLNIK